jgi:hypothetical protein
MSYSESSGWKRSWILGVIAIAAIVFGMFRVVQTRRAPSESESISGRMIQALPSDPASAALAEQAATEAVRVLGDRGGNIVLVVPVPKPLHHMTQGIAYETGVRTILKNHASVKLEGLYFAAPPYAGNDHQDQQIPTLFRLQDIRQTHPTADVIVSFLGLPQLSPEEQALWLASKPPRMIAVEVWPSGRQEVARALIAAGVMDALVINASPQRPEEQLPELQQTPAANQAPPRFEVLRRP